jgi:hypothetical protein
MIEQRILMGILIGVAAGCVLVLYPFLSALLWAGILVFTTWPVHEWIRAPLCRRQNFPLGCLPSRFLDKPVDPGVDGLVILRRVRDGVGSIRRDLEDSVLIMDGHTAPMK